MAKDRKKRTKKYKATYKTDGRVDMSQGGRVGYREGDEIRIDPATGQALQNQQAGEAEPAPIPAPRKASKLLYSDGIAPEKPAPVLETRNARADAIRQNRGQLEFDQSYDFNIPGTPGYNPNLPTKAPTGPFGGPLGGSPAPTPAPTPAPLTKETFEKERRERMIEAGREAEKIARGEIPEGIIPQQEIVSVPTGPAYESEAMQLAERKGVSPELVKEVGTEAVQQIEDISTVKTPEPVTAAKIEAEQITTAPEVAVAQGEIKQEALAKAAGVERVDPIQAVTVDIPEGALAERVIGTLSQDSKAQAAQNAGTSLARVTRAKKQLRNAGLSEEDITELGNDPEALEARLTEFTEEQRGIIEGLPQEALVSNQLDSLLSGIEEGEIPSWARPAVASVEQMLAQRGMSASTVGRDALLNAIITSAIPLAQSNAQAIQQSVSQQKTIEAQADLQNTQFRQQTAMQNAQNVFAMDMAQFSADQQTNLANSKFLQTVGLTEASMEQQSALQNAVLMSQANLAEADFYQKAQIQNAQAFLSMDMANLNIQQQANVLQAQQEQQRMLSNQAATNAARQFNAASENQTQQFMASLNTQVSQFNSQQENAVKQFNVQQANAAEARRVQNELEVNKANAAIVNQVKQFNEQIDFNREQFNVQNAQAIEQSNVEWRRKANLADTAAQNAINQENTKMAFNISSQAQAFLWQELRDQADYDFRWANDTATRKVQAMVAASSAEGDAAKNWQTNFNNVSSTIDRMFGIG